MNRCTNPFAALLLAICTACPALADGDPTIRDRVFLVVFEPGPAWVEGMPVTEQPLQAHGSYILRNYAEGRVLQAGPFGDGSGGALIYRAPSREAVEALLADDPAVVDGVMIPTVYPWTLREWDYYLSPPTQRAEGTFMLQHSASMRGGEPEWLTMTVVPDSGTDSLTGLTGEMQVEVTENGYRYTFDYTLPELPSGG